MIETEEKFDIGAWIKATVSLSDTVSSSMAEVRRAVDRLNKNTPVLSRKPSSGYAVANTNLILDLGKPDVGTFWSVENIVVGGLDVNVTAAGSAGLYVVAGLANFSPGLGNCVDYASTLPNVGFYGFRDIVVNDSERLIVVIFGATATQQYVASKAVSVYPTDAAMGRDVNISGN